MRLIEEKSLNEEIGDFVHRWAEVIGDEMTDINLLTDEQLNRLVATMVDGCWHELEWIHAKTEDGYPDDFSRCKKCGNLGLDYCSQLYTADPVAFFRAWDWADSLGDITSIQEYCFPNMPDKKYDCEIDRKTDCETGSSVAIYGSYCQDTKAQAFCRALVACGLAAGLLTEADINIKKGDE